MRRAAIFAVLVSSTIASAQPGTAESPPPEAAPPAPEPRADRAFVSGGVLVGADDLMHLAFSGEGGVKIGRTPLWGHATLAGGKAFDFEGGGPLLRAMGGLELRSCAREAVCIVGGVDAGYQTAKWSSQDSSDPVEDHSGLVIVGRVGIDTGGERIRFRGAFELAEAQDDSEVMSSTWHGGFALTFGLGYRL